MIGFYHLVSRSNMGQWDIQNTVAFPPYCSNCSVVNMSGHCLHQTHYGNVTSCYWLLRNYYCNVHSISQWDIGKYSNQCRISGNFLFAKRTFNPNNGTRYYCKRKHSHNPSMQHQLLFRIWRVSDNLLSTFVNGRGQIF